MTNEKQKFKAKYLIPAYGLKYAQENQPKGEDKAENRKYALRTLPLAAYNLVIAAGLVGAEVYGIYRGIEALVK